MYSSLPHPAKGRRYALELLEAVFDHMVKANFNIITRCISRWQTRYHRGLKVPMDTTPNNVGRLAGRWTLLPLSILAAVLPSCGGSGGSSPSSLGQPTGAHLTRIQHGKLADIYGLKSLNGSQIVELYQADMLVGPDIQDERGSNSTKRDSEILYDFISANADSLQPRLLITRDIGSKEFTDAVAALDNNLRTISPNAFGRNSRVNPYSVVARNAGIRIEFNRDLGITDDFFYIRDTEGRITGIKNSKAVQLLSIVGDPTDTNHNGDFQIIDTRLVVRKNIIILDPVLLGTEGLQYSSRNAAAGMPESANQTGSNIRIAIAVEGPLSIPLINADQSAHLNGTNNDTASSVIRDFRSGNRQDNSSDLARGFIRDPTPPRLIGQMMMYIERVESIGTTAKQLTIVKNGIHHELDRGDVIRVYIDDSGKPIANLEILQEPTDDLGKPKTQRVRVIVRPVFNAAGQDLLELHDPSEKSDFPKFAGLKRDDYLRKYAPKGILIAEFTRRRVAPSGSTTPYYGDDPLNFLSFSPRPLPGDNGQIAYNDHVSPFAGAVLRFSKPIDMATLIALDTCFFATRNLLDQSAIDEFVASRNIEPTKFNESKFRTPHLIHSRIFDEDGSQTTVRVQPTLGFYLDQAMRDAYEADKNNNLPFEERRYHYFLHLVGGNQGISDLSGNPLDFQTLNIPGRPVEDYLAMEFGLDARTQSLSSKPRFEDNIAIYSVRRFADQDEDERPSLYLPEEITTVGNPTPADGWESKDLFGPISYLPSGEIIARDATRTTKIVDSINQVSAPPQTSNLRWCPISGPSGWGSATMVSSNSASTAFGSPIRNPINPFGCRLQMIWRDIDMSLSRTDPLDFNLDVEQLYWAPFTQNPVVFDEFDRMTLYLGHSEFRPEACIASGDAFPSMPESGLDQYFTKNYAHNVQANGKQFPKPAPHPAYVDAVMTISSKDAIFEPNNVNRYIPLPKFIDASKVSNLKDPYFVWRDEQEIVQGGVIGETDTTMRPYPYLLSPFLGGKGRRVSGTVGNIAFTQGAWHNGKDRQLRNGNETDLKTGGCVGTIGLPLLADFWSYPDSPDKPVSNPFRAGGVNGWQISLPVTSSAAPYFRIYSAGKGGSSPFLLDPTHPKWKKASGGFQPGGAPTPGLDNSIYWVMADFLKRTAVVTAGFVDIANPHRMPAGSDPRLGPFDRAGKIPTYTYDFEPPLATLSAGTAVIAEFRGASKLTRANTWWPKVATNKCDDNVFPLDPLKAGDAHIHHWDNRNIQGTTARKRWWSFLYNDTLTPYTENPNNLADSAWTNSHTGPYDSFNAEDVAYFNWRFIMKNNVEATPPVSPKIESFSVAYRLSDK
jgi:hypothetical protein